MPDLTDHSDDEDPWNRWESFVGELGTPGEQHKASRSTTT